MPAIGAIGGCNDDINTSPNGLISADRETMAMSHEFFESMSDPLGGGDISQFGWTSDLSGEIGDTCNQLWGSVSSDGRNVTLNGNPYVVQEIWSNNADNCVLSATDLSGTTIESKITTGNDDLRDNTSAGGKVMTKDGSSQGIFSKFGIPGWATQSTHVRVDSYRLPLASALTEEDISLTSHPAAFQTNDVWEIQALDVKLRSPNGTVLCEQTGEGNPLFSITDSSTFKFATNCMPGPPAPEGVECFVFDDGYANIEGPSTAIFISGRPTDNEVGKACIPGGTFGHCHKWFGKCRTVTTHEPVNFQVFNDGYASMLGPGDSIIIPTSGNQACTPTGCRRWFGRAATASRSVTCSVFNDGAAMIAGPMDAIYIPSPIPSQGMACIPGLPVETGVCRRWFGLCMTN